MKILITGAAGFIGFNLALRLLERGDTVIGIDNHNDYYDPAIKEADFIARHSRFDADYHIAGPMHLSGKVPLEIDIKKKLIAVFDVMPMRRSIYATLGLSKEYFVPKTCKDFVLDIIKVASELDCHVYLKSKRTISKRVDASYRQLLESVHQYDNVTVLSGDYPAETLIKKTVASVSMPWTSTALMAKYFAKPTCCYDSRKALLHDDRGAHGIPFCIGRKELRQYL
jgi:polysaccharide biosynthesis PFTS motif protein